MLIDFIRHGFSLQLFILFATRLFVVFCILPVHEFAHALIATKLGDPTPKQNGRLTLNPLAHIDPIGGLMIFLAGVGYAKAVPVNTYYFKDKKKGMALTALAGPLSNLILAFISVVFLFLSQMLFKDTLGSVIYWFLYYVAFINISLAVFNLLPIPPLDGSRLAAVILPDRYYYKLVEYERYLMSLVLILAITGFISKPIMFLSENIMRLFFNMVGFFFTFGR